MAIHLYCQKCFTSNGIDAKECSKCKTPFARDNRKFRVSVSVKGRRATRVVDNLTIAREVESAIKADLVREEFDITHHRQKKKPITLNELWDKYLPWAKANKRTWRNDLYLYDAHIGPRFGNRPLEDITPFLLERMKNELKRSRNKQGKPFAAATIKHVLVIVRRLFNLAGKWGLFHGPNPVKGVEMPKLDNEITEFLSDEELSRLLAVLDNWPYDDSAAFVKFALFTGMRRGELFKLTWDAVDFERGMVTLAAPKGGKTTTLPICREALEVIEGLPRTSQFVFPGKGGKQRTDFKGPWARIRKAAQLPENFRLHGLRHHFASTLVSSGVDLAVVGSLLTHKQAQTTMRYAHLKPDAIKAAAAKAGELLTPGKKQRGDVVEFPKR